MKNRNQLLTALRRIEDCLSSEYRLRAQVYTDNEPLQAAMRDAINISRQARSQKTMEANNS